MMNAFQFTFYCSFFLLLLRLEKFVYKNIVAAIIFFRSQPILNNRFSLFLKIKREKKKTFVAIHLLP